MQYIFCGKKKEKRKINIIQKKRKNTVSSINSSLLEIKLEEKNNAILVGNKTYYLMEFQIQEKYPDMNKSKIKVILDQN